MQHVQVHNSIFNCLTEYNAGTYLACDTTYGTHYLTQTLTVLHYQVIYG